MLPSSSFCVNIVGLAFAFRSGMLNTPYINSYGIYDWNLGKSLSIWYCFMGNLYFIVNTHIPNLGLKKFFNIPALNISRHYCHPSIHVLLTRLCKHESKYDCLLHGELETCIVLSTNPTEIASISFSVN